MNAFYTNVEDIHSENCDYDPGCRRGRMDVFGLLIDVTQTLFGEFGCSSEYQCCGPENSMSRS